MTIDIRELQQRLQEVLSATVAGGEVIIYDGTQPRARLVPIPPVAKRVPGLHPGAIETTHDFDAPLPDEFWANETAA